MQELHNLAMLSWVYLIVGKMHDFARFCITQNTQTLDDSPL